MMLEKSIVIITPKSLRTYKRNQMYLIRASNYRFALGPLELRVIKTLDGSTKAAAAITDTMLGLMDMQIDVKTNSAAITGK